MFSAAGVVPSGGRKKFYCTSSIDSIIDSISKADLYS